ncbi:MAG: glycoside hydrolase family 15 protein [Actinomycetota bacterium]
MAERETPPSERYPPIASYALLGDGHSAALVSMAGSIDWCCFHRFDARPVFGRILDWDRGGYFRLAPAEMSRVSRRYEPDTNVLETRFQAKTGRLKLTDCLAVRPDADTSRRMPPHPYHQLIRLLECEEGEVEVDLEFHPRFDYGLTTPRLEMRGSATAVVYGGADALVLHSELEIDQTEICGCDGRSVLRAGDSAAVTVEYFLPHRIEQAGADRQAVLGRLEETRAFWRDWAGRSTYEGEHRDAVVRSALVLKALTNAPTGAIVAAPTTSLPEEIGGVRNWDYRYSWLRDSALDVYALFSLGYTDEANDFMAWVKRTTAGRADDLQIMYGVGGERLLHEVLLVDLEGYRGSKPVRIGNAAFTQFQPDIYGELLDTTWLYHRNGGEIDVVFWEFCRGVVDAVERRWQDPDHGIWEIRDEPRHFTHSKVMAWVAVHRAIKLARALDLPGDIARWVRLRDEMRRRILREGVDPETGAFVQSFGSSALDASNLLVPLVRFLPADDPRVRATMERTAKELTHDGLVMRYRADDGLPGGEGAFVICSFWLVDNLAQAGEAERARELFDRLCGFANDVGLLAEQIDPSTGEQLGNFPQAFSHVGLIGAAINLERGAG